MKKNFYVSLVLIIFALTFSGCGKKAAVENTTNSNSDENGAITQNEVSGDSEEEINASILQMLGKGKSLHCTFSLKDEKEGTEQSGEFYVDGQSKKFRSDAEATVAGTNPMKLSVKTISDGLYTYSWNSFNPKSGFKIKMDESQEQKTDNNQNSQDLNENIKFKCRSWKVDNSMFELPAGVTFTDMNEMLKQTVPNSGSGGIDLCAICSQIPDTSQRTDCQKTNCK
ncbi:MAG: hypothetical protein WCJ57_01620 [Candidatus Falkowbacteria bacterium]